MQDLEALQWRTMAAADLPAVGALSARLHPAFPERPAVLAEKLQLFAPGCFVLAGASSIRGYCFSHPWRAGPPPALDAFLGALPQPPDGYFIHDLTLEAAAQGRRCASALVPRLIGLAKDLAVPQVALVAVNRSEPFWRRMGFQRTADERVQQAARAKYDAGAVHMRRDLNEES